MAEKTGGAPPKRKYVGTLDGLKSEANPSELDTYVAAAAGTPPLDFEVICEAAGVLMQMAGDALGIDPNAPMPEREDDPSLRRLQDALLIGAYALVAGANAGNGANKVAFVQRARQVVQWCDREKRVREQTPLEELESRCREIARVVGMRVYSNEEFLVLLANAEAGGHVTWLSSMTRESSIEVVESFVASVKAAAERSK